MGSAVSRVTATLSGMAATRPKRSPNGGKWRRCSGPVGINSTACVSCRPGSPICSIWRLGDLRMRKPFHILGEITSHRPYGFPPTALDRPQKTFYGKFDERSLTQPEAHNGMDLLGQVRPGRIDQRRDFAARLDAGNVFDVGLGGIFRIGLGQVEVRIKLGFVVAVVGIGLGHSSLTADVGGVHGVGRAAARDSPFAAIWAFAQIASRHLTTVAALTLQIRPIARSLHGTPFSSRDTNGLVSTVLTAFCLSGKLRGIPCSALLPQAYRTA